MDRGRVLMRHWQLIYKENEADEAYEEFLRVFMILYEKTAL